jgi:hypothetical protein
VALSIFISYASQDRETVRQLRDALAALGLEVWYDENELGGGDAWDQKIRRQIRECTYFMPVISSNTEARLEGYFRREWRLAVERTLDMADGLTFLVPVVIDPVPQSQARVPEKFLTVQWLSLPGGKPTPAVTAWGSRLLRGTAEPPVVAGGKALAPLTGPAAEPARGQRRRLAGGPAIYPPFPEQQPGKALQFVFHVVGWAGRCAWTWYRSLKRTWRILVSVVITLMILDSRCSSSKPPHDLTATDKDRIQAGVDFATQMVKEFGDDTHKSPALLVYSFVTPAGDANADRIASAVFREVYRRCRAALPNQVGMAPSNVVDDPLKLARERDAEKMLTGEVTGSGPDQVLQVKLVDVDKGTALFTRSYPLVSADPDAVAADIVGQLKNDE